MSISTCLTLSVQSDVKKNINNNISDLSMLLACLAQGGAWSCTHAKCVMAFSLSSSSIFLSTKKH